MHQIMRTKFKFFLIVLFAFITINSLAQEKITDQTKVARHSHPEFEKSLEEIKESTKKADKTFDMAQDTYKSMDSREKTFFSTIQTIISVVGLSIALLGFFGIGSYYYSNFLNRKKIDAFFLKAKKEIEIGKKEIIETHNAELKKLVDGKEDAIRRMIQAKELDYRLRDESKIYVINHKKTPIPESFYKVLGLFKQFNKDNDLMNAFNLSEVLTTINIEKLKSYDLVIIENLVEEGEGQWKIGTQQQVLDKDIVNEIVKVNENVKDNMGNFVQNQAIMIKIADAICSNTGLIYYGPGLLKSNLIEQANQPLFAFAQAPSTLYSNMMNLLKFKDVINRI